MTERKILGVCAWLADKFGFDVTGVRIVFLICVFFYGVSPLLYILLYLIKPSEY